MKRKLIIDIDTERKHTVIIGPIKDFENQEIYPDPVFDMNIICEALCTLIHLCHQEGIKKDIDSIKDCIIYLKKGFITAGYKAFIPQKIKDFLQDICPAGKIFCKKYKFFTNEEVYNDIHPSNHKCCAVIYSLYIHDFTTCPFPDKQEI